MTDFSRILKKKKRLLNIPKCKPDISTRWAESKKLKNSLKTDMFLPNPTAGYQRYQPDIKDISRISTRYQGFLYTGYHELSPLG